MIREKISKIKMQLGWQGTSGIFLLFIAALFHMLTLKPLEKELSSVHDRLENVRSKVSRQANLNVPGDRHQELGKFYDGLLEENEVTDVLAAIYSTAERNDLQFKEASYSMEKVDHAVAEYKVSFQVRGEYSKVRQFIFNVLANNPALALEQINFQRDKISESAFKSNMILTLFLKPHKL